MVLMGSTQEDPCKTKDLSHIKRAMLLIFGLVEFLIILFYILSNNRIWP